MKLLHANDSLGKHANSWYAAAANTTQYPQLEGHLDADVCVIGAGFTGLSTALELARSGISCVLLEAHRVGWGASGRNGGQLGSGFNRDQMELESSLGESTAKDLWQIAEQAKHWIRDTCEREDINIDYQPGIVTALHRQRFVKTLHTYCEHLNSKYNYSAYRPLDKQALQGRVNSENYHGGAIDEGAGHVNPLKLARGLAQAAVRAGAHIAERSEVTDILRRATNQSQRVVTSMGSVTCRRVILATNGYIDALDDSINKRLMPINNFIVVTKPLGERAKQLLPCNDAVADSRFVVNYYRLVQDGVAQDGAMNDHTTTGVRLLFGGGENYSYRFPKNITPIVRKAMLSIFPQLQDVEIDYAWGGTLAITRNRLPYIKEVQADRYTAGGYSGHGVALACIYGKALADHMSGKNELYNVLTKLPNKPFPGGTRSRSTLLALAMSGYSMADAI